MRLRRRDLLAASTGALLPGCGPRRSGVPSAVSIVRAASYTADLAGIIRRVLQDHKLNVAGKRVVLKPNLVEFDPATAINTNPAMVQAAVEAFRSLGAAAVRIAEGPGHRRNTLELAEGAGYFTTFAGFESMFTDLNLDEVSSVTLSKPVSRLRQIYLPRTALGADLIVSMPKMKTHHWVGATLSMKNFFGLIPGAVYGWPKNILHWAGIDECIADLHTAFSRHFALVDGIVGMEGNGPIQGRPKAAGVIVAGSDMVAVDATCCRIMQIDPARIEYLKLAGGAPEESQVRQLGESIESVRTPFELLPKFQSYRLGSMR
jgi:uncharacterized protein (DUF362 family)